MDSHTTKYAIMVGALGMAYLATRSLGFASLSTFLLYLTIGLASRYPKVAIADPCLLFDGAEIFLFLTAVNLGFAWALPFMFLVIWMIAIPGIRIESPIDSSERTVGMLIGLVAFYAMMAFGSSLLVSMAVGLFVSGMVWSSLAYFVFSVTNPTLFIVAFVKAVLFLRISKQLGLF